MVLADDHPVVRAGLAALLGSLQGIEVVGVASDGREAVREVVLRPSVAVLRPADARPGWLCGHARDRPGRPEVAVLVLTMFDDDDSVFAAMRAGARGYVVKGAEQEEIGRAIGPVASGEAIFGPGIAQRVLRFFAAPPPTAADPFPELTAREREILDLLAAAMPNSMIAKSLGLSPKTVANHLSSIFAKLQVADRAQAILRARDAGLGVSRDEFLASPSYQT